MFESQRYYKIENDNITHLTLEEEVAFVSSKIKDKDLRDLYLYYYNQYIKPKACIWRYPDGQIEFNVWYEETYDDYETEALAKVVHSILPKKVGAIDDITFKNIQVKLKELHEITKEIQQECPVIDVQATNTPNTITTISEPKTVYNEPVLANEVTLKLEELKEYEEGSKEWWDALSK